MFNKRAESQLYFQRVKVILIIYPRSTLLSSAMLFLLFRLFMMLGTSLHCTPWSCAMEHLYLGAQDEIAVKVIEICFELQQIIFNFIVLFK